MSYKVTQDSSFADRHLDERQEREQNAMGTLRASMVQMTINNIISSY
ncbi:MAG: hypothetical protein JO215_08185 [Ktedonobacteraceae bacterium]|nr:hypothetical protein [Ktedonobacteraceae bacterium]MBV9615617.1 hypothetical protein [Ktedonobacteraceae bacterium]MBV9709972.1 hypothetical protein [Ktedonobacteraceae bacterium]